MHKETIGNATLYLGDCMDGMKEMPDKAFDLAIVDPPYGIGMHDQIGKKKGETGNKWIGGEWDTATPDQAYFDELMRTTGNQIIWGGNYFTLPPTRCFLVWDKGQRISMADCEMAWTSFSTSARIFDASRSNMQGFRNPDRFHPTEKPVQLYSWILATFATPGQKILDTHMGSGSSVIACLDRGFSVTAYEIDPEYFEAACLRIEQSQRQLQLAL